MDIRVNAEISELDSDTLFSLTGVHEKTFRWIASIVRRDMCSGHTKGGRPFRIMPITRAFITLFYLRTGLSMGTIAILFGISKGAVCKTCQKTVRALICNGYCSLLGRRSMGGDRAYIVDATEVPINRPLRGQREWYSGKQKCHTAKTQIIMDELTGLVVDAQFAKGSEHDWSLFRRSCRPIGWDVVIIAVKGYQGLTKLFPNGELPIKKSKKHPLDADDIEHNKTVGAVRIVIEHVNGWLKRFKAVHDRYMGRAKNFWKAMLFVIGLYNSYEVTFVKRET